MPQPWPRERRLAKQTEPLRTCVGCRRRAGASTLLRCALGADGTVMVSRSAPGRGAWLCEQSLKCVDEAVRRRRFDRAFRRPVSPSGTQSLREAFAAWPPNVRESKSSGGATTMMAPPVKG